MSLSKIINEFKALEFLVEHALVIMLISIISVVLVFFLMRLLFKRINIIPKMTDWTMTKLFGYSLALNIKSNKSFNNYDKDGDATESDVLNEEGKSDEKKSIVFINNHCFNSIVDLDCVSRLLYFTYGICFAIYMPGLAIQFLLINDVKSTSCIKGYKCYNGFDFKICDNSTTTLQNKPDLKQTLMWCRKVEFNSQVFATNLSIFYGLTKIYIILNKYSFKFGYYLCDKCKFCIKRFKTLIVAVVSVAIGMIFLVTMVILLILVLELYSKISLKDKQSIVMLILLFYLSFIIGFFTRFIQITKSKLNDSKEMNQEEEGDSVEKKVIKKLDF